MLTWIKNYDLKLQINSRLFFCKIRSIILSGKFVEDIREGEC